MSDEIIDRAHAFLRGHLTGRFRFDGDAMDLKFVVAPDGRLAASVMVAMIRAGDTVLMTPDDNDESLHLTVTLEQFDENGPHAALADRWRIYHGDPPDVRWAAMTIDAARFEGHFIDGEAIVRANPLARAEPAVLKHLNGGDRRLLRKACEAANYTAEQPLAVGVDDRGIDVKRAFDVIRIEFPEGISLIPDESAISANSANAVAAVEQALR